MSQQKAKHVTQSFFPTELVIDGARVAVRVKRLTNTQYDTFAREFAAWDDPRGSQELSAEEQRTREDDGAAWVRQSLDDYLQIVEGEWEHDGEPVLRGGQLLDIYGGRIDVVPQAMALVLLENRVSEAQKKTYRSVLASRLGSETALPTTDTGSAPVSTVSDVAPSDSALVEDVTEPLSAELCGTTVLS